MQNAALHLQTYYSYIEEHVNAIFHAYQSFLDSFSSSLV